MSRRLHSRSRSSVVAMPLKSLAYKLSIGLLLFAALAMVVAGKTRPEFAARLKGTTMDVVAPVVQVLSAPADAWHNSVNWVNETLALRDENQKLRQENAELIHQQQWMVSLENENARLREINRYAKEASLSYISARVAMDSSGPYAKTAVIYAGSEHGVKQDSAVITPQGVVGRVLEVGDNTSRVMMLADMHSRLPVVVEKSRARAIAIGDNDRGITLEYMAENTDVSVGDKIITAGDGNVVPAGLPVGLVTAIENGVIKVTPFSDLGTLEYVSVVDVPKP